MDIDLDGVFGMFLASVWLVNVSLFRCFWLF